MRTRAAIIACILAAMCIMQVLAAPSSAHGRRRFHTQVVRNTGEPAGAPARSEMMRRYSPISAPMQADEAVTVTLLDGEAGGAQPPPPPPSSGDGGFVVEEEPELIPVPSGEEPRPTPPTPPPPQFQSPFIDPDNPEATVWGNATHDGVDRQDPFCMWRDGWKFCA